MSRRQKAKKGVEDCEKPGGAVKQAMMPGHPHVAAPSDLSAEDAALRTDLIERLRRSRGNVTAVARDMSKATMQLYRLMRRLEVDPKSFR
jgi:transcriptional regulator with GAF, ATPase, and Fis domain